MLSLLLLFFFLIINTKLKGKHGNGKASELCTAPSTVNPSILTSTEIGRPTFCKIETKSTLSQGMTPISKKASEKTNNMGSIIHFYNSL